VRRRLDTLGIRVPDPVVVAVAEGIVRRKVVSDDIPQVSSVWRDKLREEQRIAPIKYIIRKKNMPNRVADYAGDILKYLNNLPASVASIKDIAAGLRPAGFGAWKRISKDWDFVSSVFRTARGVVEQSAIQWWREREPSFVNHLLRIQRKGLDRTEALDWCFGHITGNVMAILPPIFQPLFDAAVANIVEKNVALFPPNLKDGRFSAFIQSEVAPDVEAAIFASPLVQHLYLW
jgi:hypothetical protein